jgi:hypothetical protein
MDGPDGAGTPEPSVSEAGLSSVVVMLFSTLWTFLANSASFSFSSS